MKKQLLSSSCLTNESGRSMVEMLGVLAIIGILSIGGVTGYGRAIVAHRANTAIEAAQREAAIVAGDVATGQKVEPNNATVLRSPSGYEVAVRDVTGGTTDITTTTPFFGVEIGGGNGQAVQRNVAKSIVERAEDSWKNVHGIGVISGEGGSRTIKWLTSSGTGTNGFESEVPENTQTVIIIVVYATDLSPRTGDLLTDFNVTPIEDPTICPDGTSEDGSGAEATTLSNGTLCRCNGDGEEYLDGRCVSSSCSPECGTGASCQNGVCVCDNGNTYLTNTPDAPCMDCPKPRNGYCCSSLGYPPEVELFNPNDVRIAACCPDDTVVETAGDGLPMCCELNPHGHVYGSHHGYFAGICGGGDIWVQYGGSGPYCRDEMAAYTEEFDETCCTYSGIAYAGTSNTGHYRNGGTVKEDPDTHAKVCCEKLPYSGDNTGLDIHGNFNVLCCSDYLTSAECCEALEDGRLEETSSGRYCCTRDGSGYAAGHGSTYFPFCNPDDGQQ